MRSWLKLVRSEMRLFMREPMAAFFTLLFPIMMLVLFGSIYGNDPTPLFGGLGTVDISTPAYAGMVIATSSLMTLSIVVATYRETGILRRLRLTPVKPLTVLAAISTALVFMTCMGILGLCVIGRVFYGLHLPENPLQVLLALIVSILSFFSLGFMLASIVPSARTAQIVSMVIFYPMLFLSGASIPSEILPENIRKAAQVLPLTHVVTIMRGTWTGNPLSQYGTSLLVLFGILVVGLLVSARTFRWE